MPQPGVRVCHRKPSNSKSPGRGFPFALPRSRCEGGPARNAQPAPRAQEKGAPRGPSAREAPCASATSCPPAAGAAVLSAMAGLASGFGTGPGDPRLHGRARAGRSAPRAASPQGARTRATLAAAQRASNRGPPHAGHAMRRARAISGARLSASPRLHLRPIDLLVWEGPYRRENSSRRRLPT